MWDVFFNAILVVIGAELGSKALTGKWVHEHLYEWWREISEKIDAWVKAHEELKIARVVAWVDRKLDHAVVRANRMVKVLFKAISIQKSIKPRVITEEVLSAAEVAKQFPGLDDPGGALVVAYRV